MPIFPKFPAALLAPLLLAQGIPCKVADDVLRHNPDELHGRANQLSKDNALTEGADPVDGVSDKPIRHDILTERR